MANSEDKVKSYLKSWSKWGDGGRHVNFKDEGGKWVCQICAKVKQEDDERYSLYLDSSQIEKLATCNECNYLLTKHGISSFDQVMPLLEMLHPTLSVKPKKDTKGWEMFKKNSIMNSEDVVERLFQATKGDITKEYTLLVEFLEQFVNDILDDLTPSELKLVAESILIRLEAYQNI